MPPNVDLIDLFPRFSDAECSDPLDRVYGLRALARDGSSLVVDYSKACFDLVVDLSMLSHIRQLRSRKLEAKSNDARSNDDILNVGKFWYSNLLFDRLNKGLHNMPEPESLMDKDSDWLTLPFMSVSGSSFRLQPCHFYHPYSSIGRDISSLCLFMECSLSFGSDGTCESAQISTVIINQGGHPITDPQRCAKTKETLCELFRTQVCLCRVRAGIHISRLLFAALLYLTSFHSLPQILPGTPRDNFNKPIVRGPHPFETRIPTRLRSRTKSSLQCNCDRVVADLVPMFREDAKRLSRAR